MAAVLWIPIGVIALGSLSGLILGARSVNSNARTGVLIGLFLSVMFTFPLLALGLSTS